jgi:hypothetical protein
MIGISFCRKICVIHRVTATTIAKQGLDQGISQLLGIHGSIGAKGTLGEMSSRGKHCLHFEIRPRTFDASLQITALVRRQCS